MTRLGGFASVFLALAWLSGPGPARAQEELVRQMSHEDLKALVQGMGFECERLDDKAFRFELDGYKVVMFNFEKNCQLYAGFTANCSLRQINEWNRTKRFSRAYIDDEGDPCVEADLDFEGGVSRDGVKEFIRTFRLSVRQFAKFLDAT